MNAFTGGLFLLLALAVHGRRLLPERDVVTRMPTAGGYSYKTYYYKTRVDKFGTTTDEQFKMRYLVNDDHFTADNNPILFYAGNEGDVTSFANNTGVMFELAAEINALVIFAEHRYYGESTIDDNKNFNYLSSEYALADYVDFLKYIKTGGISGTSESPVVVFGGSYGGMLAAWMRIKYPWVVIGAWAASAPVAWFANLTDCRAYDDKVTEDFAAAAAACPVNIRNSWDVIRSYGKTEAGRQQLSIIFNTCDEIKDVEPLIGEIVGAWSDVAMVNYPYPTSFLEPMPAWPVSVICSHLNETNYSDEELMVHLAAAVKVFYNYYDQYSCFNLSESEIGLDDQTWGYQACSEMVMPMCSNSQSSMFEPASWDWKTYSAYCEIEYHTHPQEYWAIERFGARDIQGASNIIFSNGALDPWGPGGVSDDMGNPSIYPIYIQDSAHHLDLRASNPADPETVTVARATEKSIVKAWIKEYQKNNYYYKHTSL